MKLLPEDTEVHHSSQHWLTDEQIARNIANTKEVRRSGALLNSDNSLPTSHTCMHEIYLAADTYHYPKDSSLRLSRRAILTVDKESKLALKKCAKAKEGGKKQSILRSLCCCGRKPENWKRRWSRVKSATRDWMIQA